MNSAYFYCRTVEYYKSNFIWQGNSTLCNNCENGCMKDVDIFYKIISLPCSWIKRLFEDNSHDWKLISLFLIKRKFGISLNIRISLNVH